MTEIKYEKLSDIFNEQYGESVIPISTNISEPEIEIENLLNVKESKIQWLWKDKIAFGKMTLFAGEPGVGKSQLLLYIAGVVSRGDRFHLESKSCEQGKVLLISGEDKADDTIKPRLMALNANLENIDSVKGFRKLDKQGNEYYDAICLVENLGQLEKIIKEKKYKLIIVDPISLYLGSVDENKNKEIRSALSILSALAERNNCALVLNSHFTKGNSKANTSAINRIMGSIGFAAAARIVFGIMKDPENPERRLFVPIKNNIGEDKIGYAYNIKPFIVNNSIETSHVSWLNEKIEKSANEIMNQTAEIKSPRLEEAKSFLLEKLKFGSVHLVEIRNEATAMGLSADTLYKAKNELNIFETDSISGRKRKIWMLSPS